MLNGRYGQTTKENMMEKSIKGRAFVLGDNIDTDQIIPAQYLSYDPSDPAERKYFGVYALSGVPSAQSGLPDGEVPFVPDGKEKSEFSVIIAGRNFGCGSSREHAPLAIAEAGCCAVVAESFARIFFRNSINGGYLAPMVTQQRLIDVVSTGDEVEVNPDKGVLRNLTDGSEHKLQPLGSAGEILQAGGIFQYARKTGML